MSALVFALASSAFAGFEGPGATPGLTVVKAAAAAKDDAKVTLEGYLVREIRAEHYIFRDATGEIEVEIDNEDFRGLKVTPGTRIRIVGEVDKDRTSTTIDVDYVEPAE